MPFYVPSFFAKREAKVAKKDGRTLVRKDNVK